MLAAASRARLADLDYDFDALAEVMRRYGWTTVDLVWRESAERYHARNPFPVGGVVEDPATGAAAAAFGGYLRELGLVTRPGTIAIRQGEDMGRTSELLIEASRAIRAPGSLGQAVPLRGVGLRPPPTPSGRLWDAVGPTAVRMGAMRRPIAVAKRHSRLLTSGVILAAR
ncbi:hypothetical protein SVIOM74S_04612 [Streptomyces violarus]